MLNILKPVDVIIHIILVLLYHQAIIRDTHYEVILLNYEVILVIVILLHYPGAKQKAFTLSGDYYIIRYYKTIVRNKFFIFILSAYNVYQIQQF